MNKELEKFEDFLAEAERVWLVNPDMVLSFRFYDLWEETRRPMPFRITERSVSINGHEIELATDHNCIACVCWDAAEECSSLVVEGDNARQKILITFDDGHPRFSDPQITFVVDSELTYGQRLEVIFDFIPYIRRTNPSLDFSAVTRKEYLDFLPTVKDKFTPQALKVMKQLPLHSILKLIKKAVEDMAADEISNQLTLPLDGTYAQPKIEEPTSAESEPEFYDAGKTYIAFYRRSRWTVLRDLQFIHSAYSKLADFENTFFIAFDDSQILKQTAPNRLTVKVKTSQELPVPEGARLPIYRRGDKDKLGSFLVDFYDCDYVVGQLIFDDKKIPSLTDDKVFARITSSPTRFLTSALQAKMAQFERQGDLGSTLLNAVLGLDDLRAADTVGTPDDKTDDLDRSQSRARVNALDDENKMIAIQGPPGTGKTHVLEQTIRDLHDEQKRILMTAPSNTAVDNVCRRVDDLPVLRLGRSKESIAPDVADACWIANPEAIKRFKQKKKHRGSVYCGTHLGILRDELVSADIEKNGLFDVIIFDEAGMAAMIEFLLCLPLAKRVILFGDHQQLPPFPLPPEITEELEKERPALREHWSLLTKSALEWLIRERHLSPYLLQSSYRCQNPRLLRFSSTLFYNARVKTSERAEYFRLSFNERQNKYPQKTLRLYRTSNLPLKVRQETLALDGKRPGLENKLEAELTARILYELLVDHEMNEITIIAPYRRQVKLIRSTLSLKTVRQITGNDQLTGEDWNRFLFARISTVDSFQGGESDAVIISYVRSNNGAGIGFVDNPNRINVAHTRCRKEMVIIGDFDTLKRQSKNSIFEMMERALERDGEVINLTAQHLREFGIDMGSPEEILL